MSNNVCIRFPEGAVLSKDSRSEFKFEENKKVYRAINSNKKIGFRLRIDGKIYSDGTRKCDYGLLVEDGRFFLIELKGVDVSSACKQLLTTLKLLKKNYINYKFKFFCRIVSKRGLPKINTNMQKLKKEISNANNNYQESMFLSRENLLEENI